MITCSNPRYIHIRNHTYAVGCGRCAACRIKTADKLSKRIDIEHLASDTAYFGTLTYDNKSLPVFKVDSCDGINYVNPVTDRVVKDLNGCSMFEFTDAECNSYDTKMWDNIHSRTKLPYRYVPLIYIRDFQLFWKRFKKYLLLFGYDKEFVYKIRYYYCGEYGTKYLRPHFHFLLFLDSCTVNRIPSEHITEAVHKAWQYGRIDFQRSKGKASSYLSEYLSGYSNLPRLHILPSARPRARHSNSFGEQLLPETPEEVLSFGLEWFNPQPFALGGRVQTILPPSSIELRLFPKCPRYNDLLPDMLKTSYFSYRRAIEENTPAWMSVESLARYLSDKQLKSPLYRDLTRLYGDVISFESLRSILYCSMRFYRCCKKFGYSEFDYLDVIRKYYSFKELNKLSVFYRSQQEFCEKYVNGKLDYDNLKYLLFWYDDFPFYDEHFVRSRLCDFDNTSLRFFYSLFQESPAFLETSSIPEFGKLSYRSNPMYRDTISRLDELFQNRVKHRFESEIYANIDSFSV